MFIEVSENFFLVIAVITFFAFLFHYLKQPTIVGFILGGLIAGPYGLKLIGSLPGARIITDIGIILLLFTIGLEFSFKRLKYLWRLFLKLGVSQVIFTTLILGVLEALIFKINFIKSFFIGGILSLSSTAVVLKLLLEKRQAATPHGSATLAIQICQDLASIPLILAIPLMSSSNINFNIYILAIWFIKFTCALFLLWTFSKWVIPFILEKVVKTHSRELFFFSIILLCFGIALITHKLGLSLALGAFFAGVMISESVYAKQITLDILPLKDNFLGLFFASIGMLIDLKFFYEHFFYILALSLLIIILKGVIVLIISLVMKQSLTTAIITAIWVFQIGEFSLVILNLGYAKGIVELNELQYLMSISIITMILTPLLFDAAPKIARFFTKDTEENSIPDFSDIHSYKLNLSYFRDNLIIGYGVVGKEVATILKHLKIPYRIIEQNYDAVISLKKSGEKIYYGDATRREILEMAGINNVKLCIICVSHGHAAIDIARVIRNIRPDLKLIIRLQFARDAEELKNFPNADIVVAEYESALEILELVISECGFPKDKAQKCIEVSRSNFKRRTENTVDYMKYELDLPVREAISNIRPIVISEKSKVIGKSISDIELSTLTGAIAIAIYRKDEGMIIPRGDFRINAGDVIHLIGDKDSFELAYKILT